MLCYVMDGQGTAGPARLGAEERFVLVREEEIQIGRGKRRNRKEAENLRREELETSRDQRQRGKPLVPVGLVHSPQAALGQSRTQFSSY